MGVEISAPARPLRAHLRPPPEVRLEDVAREVEVVDPRDDPGERAAVRDRERGVGRDDGGVERRAEGHEAPPLEDIEVGDVLEDG